MIRRAGRADGWWLCCYFTVKAKVAVFEVLPLVPLSVIVKVPLEADLETVMVYFVVPEPVTEVGLILPVTPDGRPDAEKVMVELKPPVAVAVTVTEPLLPREIEPEVGETEMVKLGVTAEVTVRINVVVWAVPLAGVPVTVMV